jgi:tRNA-2-methylthio-N6-dimethylallyladenosine synthase
MNNDQLYYFIKTYGCQANIKDSQIMVGTLEALGFSETQDYRLADLIILNSCSVRQKSEDKVYGWGIKLDPTSKKSQGKPKITKRQVKIVTGCMVGSALGERKRYSDKVLKEKMEWVDYFLSPDQEVEIPNILVKEGLLEKNALSVVVNEKPEKLSKPKHENLSEWAYVNISTGCDNFCTFCVVPYARGEEKSITEAEILAEISHLTSRGYKRIMLLGQNVNSWGLSRETKFKLRAGSDDAIPFASLLRRINGIDEIEKISFMSSNPFDFTVDLIDALSLPKIDKYLHIAVQSGNNEILKKMNRRHTIEEFKDLISSIKKSVPEMTFGTDIIVGFPGESEEQFMDTVNLIQEIKFNVAFISIYSPRIGTVSSKLFKDDIPVKEKKRRHTYLTKVWKKSLLSF